MKKNNKDNTNFESNSYNIDDEQYLDALAGLEEPKTNLSKLSSSSQGREYLQSLSAGVVWIFMFLSSLFAVFLILKTPNNSYYDTKEPFIIENSGSIRTNIADFESNNALTLNNTVIPNSNTTITTPIKEEDTKQQLLEKETNSLVQDSTIISGVTTVDKSTGSGTSTNNTNTANTNTEDSEITKLLKNNISTTENKPSAVVEKAPNPIVTKKPAVVNAPKVAANNVNAPLGNIWLVNIYSSSTKEGLQTTLTKLKSEKAQALKDVNFYFTESTVVGKTTYRISIAKKNSTSNILYYTTQQDAQNFCSQLKASSIDCFTSPVQLANLPKYLVK